jgi:hypothetical protein
LEQSQQLLPAALDENLCSCGRLARARLARQASRIGVGGRADLHKQHTGVASIDYKGALDEALSFGWVG